MDIVCYAEYIPEVCSPAEPILQILLKKNDFNCALFVKN